MVWRLIPGQISIQGFLFFMALGSPARFLCIAAVRRNGKMIRSDFHPLDQIETVRVEALHAGIELEIVTTVSTRLLYKPIEQPPTETARSISIARHQIVDIEKFSAE